MNGYHAYEAAKRFWVLSHPNATAVEYEAACARLAKKYGV